MIDEHYDDYKNDFETDMGVMGLTNTYIINDKILIEVKKLPHHHENTLRHNVLVAHDVSFIANKLNLPQLILQSFLF